MYSCGNCKSLQDSLGGNSRTVMIGEYFFQILLFMYLVGVILLHTSDDFNLFKQDPLVLYCLKVY
jgi:hypothetical protein